MAGLLIVTACTNHVTNVVQTAAVAPAGQAGSVQRPATGNPTVQLSRVVISGTKQRIDFAAVVNPDCSVAGDLVVRVKSPPIHGAILSETVSDFPSFAKENPRSSCNTQRVPGMGIFYAAQSGYVGPDQATVEVIAPNGTFRTSIIHISVE